MLLYLFFCPLYLVSTHEGHFKTMRHLNMKLKRAPGQRWTHLMHAILSEMLIITHLNFFWELPHIYRGCRRNHLSHTVHFLKSEMVIVKQLQHLPLIWRNGPLQQILSKVETTPQNHSHRCVILKNAFVFWRSSHLCSRSGVLWLIKA